ncbi:unnamed protein product [Calypogeia fissa]
MVMERRTELRAWKEWNGSGKMKEQGSCGIGDSGKGMADANEGNDGRWLKKRKVIDGCSAREKKGSQLRKTDWNFFGLENGNRRMELRANYGRWTVVISGQCGNGELGGLQKH